MSLSLVELQELKSLISDRLYLQVAKWNLSLGDAGLAEALAIECNANLEKGPAEAALKALENIKVPLAGGKTQLSLAQLLPQSQFFELEEMLEDFCR